VFVEILKGDCRDVLQLVIPDKSVHCCVTSPPYFGLRDYGVEGQIGLEQTPEQYVSELVSVLREVRRVLRDDGTLWLNLGDSYAGSWGNAGGHNRGKGTQRAITVGSVVKDQAERNGSFVPPGARGYKDAGIKPKDLIGIPWRVAFALQADGWYLRQDIIWHKPNPMPESVRDRCTKAHEYIFLLSKSERYYFDHEAMREDAVKGAAGTTFNKGKTAEHHRGRSSDCERIDDGKRNRRGVWTVTTKPFKGAHFATYPPDLIKPCIEAGCPVGGTVIDPFFGSGTTGLVARNLGRKCIGIELNPNYVAIAKARIAGAE